MREKILTAISFYSQRNRRDLAALITSLRDVANDLVIVENDDECQNLEISRSGTGVLTLVRPNLGMNIGAWDAAYRVFPDYDYYVFLQDECVLIDPLYQEKYISKLSTRSMGMTGECINPKWNSTWDLMRQSPLNYPIKSSSGEVITDRISNYLHYFRRWGIDPGETGSHLRSLTWGFTSECLRAINGFPIGLNKEQCIAAEIGVSRKVASLGFEFGPVSDSPFACFRHQEWRADGFAKDVRSQDKKQ